MKLYTAAQKFIIWALTRKKLINQLWWRCFKEKAMAKSLWGAAFTWIMDEFNILPRHLCCLHFWATCSGLGAVDYAGWIITARRGLRSAFGLNVTQRADRLLTWALMRYSHTPECSYTVKVRSGAGNALFKSSL